MTDIPLTIQEELDCLEKLKRNGALADDEYLMAVAKLNQQQRHSVFSAFQAMSPAEKRQKIMFIITLLGISSILAGFGLMIGANWAVIPAIAKLGGALGLLALSFIGIFYCHTNNHANWKEVCLFISFFLIGGNMAVIQQTFNLAIEWEEGCAIWWLLSLPLLPITKRRYLPVCSVILFVLGTWDYLVQIIEHLNYLMISGLLSIIVFLSFLGGKKSSIVRNIAFCLAIFTLFAGDVGTESPAGIISTIIFLLFIAALPKTEDRAIRFCHYMFVFMAFRIFLLFCKAYHNLMSIGIQLVVFGTILLILAGVYYYFFDKIQSAFKRLVHHE